MEPEFKKVEKAVSQAYTAALQLLNQQIATNHEQKTNEQRLTFQVQELNSEKADMERNMDNVIERLAAKSEKIEELEIKLKEKDEEIRKLKYDAIKQRNIIRSLTSKTRSGNARLIVNSDTDQRTSKKTTSLYAMENGSKHPPVSPLLSTISSTPKLNAIPRKERVPNYAKLCPQENKAPDVCLKTKISDNMVDNVCEGTHRSTDSKMKPLGQSTSTSIREVHGKDVNNKSMIVLHGKAAAVNERHEKNNRVTPAEKIDVDADRGVALLKYENGSCEQRAQVPIIGEKFQNEGVHEDINVVNTDNVSDGGKTTVKPTEICIDGENAVIDVVHMDSVNRNRRTTRTVSTCVRMENSASVEEKMDESPTNNKTSHDKSVASGVKYEGEHNTGGQRITREVSDVRLHPYLSSQHGHLSKPVQSSGHLSNLEYIDTPPTDGGEMNEKEKTYDAAEETQMDSQLKRFLEYKATKDEEEKRRLPNYKYVEVVRGKDKRNKLKGYDCDGCRKFYENVKGDLTSAQRKQMISRHRHASSPPSTPPGFWDLTFPDPEPENMELDNLNANSFQDSFGNMHNHAYIQKRSPHVSNTDTDIGENAIVKPGNPSKKIKTTFY
eukprot:CFRG1556T1